MHTSMVSSYFFEVSERKQFEEEIGGCVNDSEGSLSYLTKPQMGTKWSPISSKHTFTCFTTKYFNRATSIFENF